jgi:hypothetical protein
MSPGSLVPSKQSLSGLLTGWVTVSELYTPQKESNYYKSIIVRITRRATPTLRRVTTYDPVEGDNLRPCGG